MELIYKEKDILEILRQHAEYILATASHLNVTHGAIPDITFIVDLPKNPEKPQNAPTDLTSR